MKQPGKRDGGGTVHGAVADVKRLRQAVSLSDRDVADMLGVSVKQVQAWEEGREQPEQSALANLRQVARRLRDIGEKTAPKTRPAAAPPDGGRRRRER
jgi:transcriptional regulator with XRE-family HTH domain